MSARVAGPHVWCPHCQMVEEQHWHVPAWCTADRRLFPSPILLMSGGSIDSVVDSWARCPTCLQPGLILDGVYVFTTEALKLVTAPEYTYRRLAEVALALDVARRQGSPQAAVRTVTRADAALGAKIKKLFEWKGASALFAGLTLLAMAIIPMVERAMADDGLDEQDVIRIVEDAVEESERYDDRRVFTEAVEEALRRAEERQSSPPPAEQQPPTPP